MALHVPVIYNIARLQNAQGIEFLPMVYGIGSHGVEYLWVFIGIDLGIRKPEHGKRRGRRRRTGAGALGGRSGQARICRGDRRAFRSGQRKLHTGIIRGKGTADPFLFSREASRQPWDSKSNEPPSRMPARRVRRVLEKMEIASLMFGEGKIPHENREW